MGKGAFMNVVNVTINGIQLKIKGVENSEYIFKVARIVEALYNKLYDNNSKLSIHELYLLTAINAVDEMLKLSDEVKKVEDEKAILEREYLELKNKLNKLEVEIASNLEKSKS